MEERKSNWKTNFKLENHTITHQKIETFAQITCCGHRLPQFKKKTAKKTKTKKN